ncbi:MAG: phage holin family protein [Vicinamibacteria bacterium]
MASATSAHPHPTEGLRALLGDVVDHVRTLFRLEVALARDEVRRSVLQVRRGMMFLAAAIVLGTVALMALCAALVAGLATVVPVWASAAIWAVVFAGTALPLARLGMDGLRLESSSTVESLQETKEWLASRS